MEILIPKNDLNKLKMTKTAPRWVKVIYSIIMFSGFFLFSLLGLIFLPINIADNFARQSLMSLLTQSSFVIAIVSAWICFILTLNGEKISTYFVIIYSIFISIGTYPVFLLSLNCPLNRLSMCYFIALGPCLAGIVSLLCSYLYLRK